MTFRAVAVVALAFAVAGCARSEVSRDTPPSPQPPPVASESAPPPRTATTTADRSRALRRAVTPAGLREHLVAFERIARAHDGTRAAGTPGYDASARYVRDLLRSAGYEVRFQEFPFEQYVATEEGRELSPTRRDLDPIVMEYSPSTPEDGIEAPLALVPLDEDGTHGCERGDFADAEFQGTVALVRRGICKFSVKAANARAAGARALVVYADFRGEFHGSLGNPGNASIPVVSVSEEVGEALTRDAEDGRAVVSLAVSGRTIERSRSVIAETKAAGRGTVVMAGGHLDSVEAGPGLNDNASGSALLLEVALRLAEITPHTKVRFAFWGAEEAGLVGSEHYVERLSEREQGRIRVYLNFDMVGSRNFVRSVYAGSPAEGVFSGYFRARDVPFEPWAASRSDHLSFRAEGIATGGLFTGASSTKTAAEARHYGGEAGEPYDPCYHEPCDGLANVDLAVLHEMADAAAHAIIALEARR